MKLQVIWSLCDFESFIRIYSCLEPSLIVYSRKRGNLLLQRLEYISDT